MDALVVPSIREGHIKQFLENWREKWDGIVIVVEDNPEKTFELQDVFHYSWKEIDSDLGKDGWIISRRNSAIRNYGFLKANQMGVDNIFTLDDDCYPAEGQDFQQGHIRNLTNFPKWGQAVPGFHTRGMPYRNLGILENVVLSVGLWEGDPDLDSIHMLTGHLGKLTLPKTRILPAGQYFPICGMNFAFKKQILPLCYFPPNGLHQEYDRFDDIWFGVIVKRICDHLGWRIACGEPYIFHSRASCPFKNLVKEAKGIGYNETFWSKIDSIEISGDDPASCICSLANGLLYKDDYLRRLGECLLIWAKLCE